MSIFSDLVEKVTGLDLDGSSQSTAQHPCSNCPSNCAIAGEACALCEPYKKRLIDAVYHVDHIDEFRAQYEVVSNITASPAGGTITCPRCGGPSANHSVCDYCGATLSDEPVSSGKIQVTAASDIPNPIMDAQNIIFERYAAIVKKFTAQKSSSGSFFSNLFSELFETDSDDDSDSTLGAKMSEAEIKEAAALYKVSVGEYLTGLDNGKYLNLSAKKAADAQGHSGWSPASAGAAGLAGIGMFAHEFMSEAGRRKHPQNVPQRPHRPDENRPSRPQQYSDAKPSKPAEPRPSQSKSKPDRDSFSRPASQNKPQHEEHSQSDHWKERDPSRRRRG